LFLSREASHSTFSLHNGCLVQGGQIAIKHHNKGTFRQNNNSITHMGAEKKIFESQPIRKHTGN
jgi:hypothetical protein